MSAASFLLIVCLLAPEPWHEDVGSIGGIVLDGSARRTPVAGTDVVLRVKMDGEFVVAAETTTDEEGKFRFEPLPIRSDLLYLAGANRGDVHYPGQRLRLTAETSHVDVQLVVYDAIVEPSPLIARQHDVLIVPERGVLKVTETILIDNPTSKCYVGRADEKDADPVTLRLAIPSDFERTTFHTEFFGRRFSLANGVLVTSIPWEPGPRELAFTYLVPNTKQQRLWERSLDLPCSKVRVRIRCDKPDDVACSLQPGTATQSGEVVFESDAGTLPAGYTMRVELGHLPIPWMTYGRWLALGILVSLIGVSAAVMVRRQRATKQPAAPQAEAPADRKRTKQRHRKRSQKTPSRRAA